VKKIQLFLTLCLAGWLVSCTLSKEVKLPAILSDGVVFQHGIEITIWGWADPHSKVIVEWQGKTHAVLSNGKGEWTLILDPLEPGGPYTMKVNDIEVNDILIGNVYFCSGQSNMELPIRRCMDVVAEYVKDYANPNIHYVKIPLTYNFEGPASDVRSADWQALTPEAAQQWGALCYFIAKGMYEQTGIPVGIINSSVGGSPVEAWMREGILINKDLETYWSTTQNKAWLDSIRYFNAHVYSDWQELHNSMPENKDAKWEKVDVFSRDWAVDSEGKALCGSHYFRHNIRLTDSQAASDAILHLGALVDADSVFVNGQYVGNTTYMYPPRNYKVPASVLKAGDNIIDIHLYVCNGAPGQFVADKEYSLETSCGSVSLLEGWEHRDGRRMPPRPGEVFLQYKAVGLYNGMVAPFLKLKHSGFVWYQGESNVGDKDYREKLLRMIADWRKAFGSSQDFYIVELASFEHSELHTAEDNGWVAMQDLQRQIASEEKGVYLIPNRDLGEWNDIHPQDKKTLGERAVNVILNH